MSEKPTDRVDWALGEARRMVSERPHSPQARSAAVLADEVCRLREELDRQKDAVDYHERRAEDADSKVRRLTEVLTEARDWIADDLMPGNDWQARLLNRIDSALLTDSPPESGEDYDYLDDSAEGRWGVKSSPPDRTWENPGPEGLVEDHRPAPGFEPNGGGA